jgi:hypothetical protein
VQVSSKADHLSEVLGESINEDDMSMLDMDQGMSLEAADLADCMVSAMWPGDLAHGSRSRQLASCGMGAQGAVSQEGSVADPLDAGSDEVAG